MPDEMPDPGVTDEDGAALAVVEEDDQPGPGVVVSCADVKCGPCTDACPFYWRARNCVLPKCYVYICSDAVCAQGGTIAPGTVFEAGGGCYTVLGGRKYLKNPGDGTPPPDGFFYIPPGAFVVAEKVVVCLDSCAQCPPGTCTGLDCVSGPQKYGIPVGNNKSKCSPTTLPGCCDTSGSSQWSGYAEDNQPNSRTTWEWNGSIQGFPGGPNGPKAIEKFYLVRTYYGPDGVGHPTIFDFSAGYQVQYDAVCAFTGGQGAVGYGFVAGSANDEDTCSYSHSFNGGSFSATWFKGTLKYKESWSRTPGQGKCGPVCPGPEEDGPEVVPGIPGENDFTHAGGGVGQGGNNALGGGGGCLRCGGVLRADGRCWCGWCGGCGG